MRMPSNQFEPRATPPTDELDRVQCDAYREPLYYRVWKHEETYEGQGLPWKCLAAFYYLTCALDYIADCQDKGVDVVFQSPANVRLIKHDERRVVYKGEA